MIEYNKIETVYERSEGTKKLIEGLFRNEAVEYLADKEWIFTEKIDGTNISKGEKRWQTEDAEDRKEEQTKKWESGCLMKN